MLEEDDGCCRGLRSRSRDRASSSIRCARASLPPRRHRQTHWRRPQPIAPPPSDIKRRKLIPRDSSPSLQNVQCTPRRILIHSPTRTARPTSEYLQQIQGKVMILLLDQTTFFCQTTGYEDNLVKIRDNTAQKRKLQICNNAVVNNIFQQRVHIWKFSLGNIGEKNKVSVITQLRHV